MRVKYEVHRSLIRVSDIMAFKNNDFLIIKINFSHTLQIIIITNLCFIYIPETTLCFECLLTNRQMGICYPIFSLIEMSVCKRVGSINLSNDTIFDDFPYTYEDIKLYYELDLHMYNIIIFSTNMSCKIDTSYWLI